MEQEEGWMTVSTFLSSQAKELFLCRAYLKQDKVRTGCCWNDTGDECYG